MVCILYNAVYGCEMLLYKKENCEKGGVKKGYSNFKNNISDGG
jgi:hypothetical protein